MTFPLTAYLRWSVGGSVGFRGSMEGALLKAQVFVGSTVSLQTKVEPFTAWPADHGKAPELKPFAIIPLGQALIPALEIHGQTPPWGSGINRVDDPPNPATESTTRDVCQSALAFKVNTSSCQVSIATIHGCR